MRQYLTAIIVAFALTAVLCMAYAAEQQAHAEYVSAQRGPK